MFAVALDGPSGAGKSSIAKAVAEKLDFIYIDTGAMYRAIALYMMEHGIDTKDAASIEPVLPDIKIELSAAESGQRVILCGRDVTALIRTPQVSMETSNCAAHPVVRNFLLALQRDLAAKNNVIMDGRDIGTVVLPNAQLKVFLTATAEERARRRVAQLKESGHPAEYEAIYKDIVQRDYQDMHRETAPLKQAEDAVLLDSTNLTFDEVVEKLSALTEARMKEINL